MIVPDWLWVLLGISTICFIMAIIAAWQSRKQLEKLNKELENMQQEITETLIEVEQNNAATGKNGVICNECGHRHYSWYEDPSGGFICDWCIIGIKCGQEN